MEGIKIFQDTQALFMKMGLPNEIALYVSVITVLTPAIIQIILRQIERRKESYMGNQEITRRTPEQGFHVTRRRIQ